MVFSSTIFIFLFLPIFLALYYLTPGRFKNLFILIGGYFFYSWGAPRFAFLLLGTITADYLVSLLIFELKFGRLANKQLSGVSLNYLVKLAPKILFIISILMNLGLLAYFKYSNFFVEQFDALLSGFGFSALAWSPVLLPIGISFTIFQELSYIFEVYRGNLKPARSLIDFAAYLMLFPHVIAGPIVRYSDIAEELKSRRHSLENLSYGVYRFSLGLGKKVLLANYLGEFADQLFNLSAVAPLPLVYAWLGIIGYALQIYFDFSGYSDMAIGLARLLGFHFKENFNYPYISQNITEFWRRWHISLSTWMREYLYIPLGGNRISPARTYINLWLVFLLSGLWHGANWNFIIWGAIHGLFLTIDRLFWLKISSRLSRGINIFLTFLAINLSWVFFRIEDLSLAWRYLKSLFNFSAFRLVEIVSSLDLYSHRQLFIFILAIFVSFFPATKLFERLADKLTRRFIVGQLVVKYFFSFLILFLSLMSLTNSQFNPFIYFRF